MNRNWMFTIPIIVWIFTIPSITCGQPDSPALIEPSLIKMDIDTLISKLKEIHPTFSKHYEEIKLQSRIDSIKSSIDYPMSALDFFRIMQPIICIDGHTTLTYTGEIHPNIENPFFPFTIIIYGRNLYVKDNLSGDRTVTKGTIIENINGIPSQTIMANLTNYIPGEKESYKLKVLEKEFHSYFRLVYGSFSEFKMTVNKAELKVKGAKWSDLQTSQRPKFELRFYDNDIAYIYKRSFKPPRDFINFMGSAFSAISEKNIKYLIIDNLRGGGLTDLADSLMSYFTEKTYRIFEKKMTKVSHLTKDYVDSKKSEGYMDNGYFVQEFPTHRVDRSNRFSGTTYILTGPLSYSTGTCFPASAKCHRTAIIVGEEAGQPLLSNGDLNRFTLPHTNLVCYSSLSIIYMPCNLGDTQGGVIPDYIVSPELDDMLNDTEYTLEHTLKLIREKNNKHTLK